MSRWHLGAALVGVVALLLAGCGKPADVDGDLTDDWRPIAEAEPFIPAAGACLSSRYAETSYLATYDPVDCAESHHTETAYVGSFAGAEAERAAPPAAGSPAMHTAYADCDKQVKAYLGDDWRTARLWLGVTVPNPGAWSGGARWYRCELAEVSSVENYSEFQQRTGSLKGALTSSSPLDLGCYAVKLLKDDNVGPMNAIDCSRSHRAEFVGVYSAPDVPYPTGNKRRDLFLAGCRAPLAKFANVPNDDEIKYRSGLIWIPAEEKEWKAGNRGVRCYLWMDDKDLKRSMRNAGPSALPAD